MICNACGHVFIDELVDVCQCGFGDNSIEYVVCPDCGRMQRVPPFEACSGELSHA